jgi:16S rRNA (cytidine1402-2'-O)-methyltransferase
VLKEVDIILAEDTRKTGFLLKHYNIAKKQLISFYEHNEAKKIDWVIKALQDGKNVALVSSAGTPTISDPGFRLIGACREKGLAVTAAPGVSSFVAALSLTNLAHEQFMFLGYAPRKGGPRKKLLRSLLHIKTTFIFLESPYRVEKTISDIGGVFPGKRVAVARELTKKFEEVLEGYSQELPQLLAAKPPRGEYMILIENR